MKRLVLKFMEHGLLWAIIVWAAAVGLMAYHAKEPSLRWAFAALSTTGVVLVAVINWARKRLQTASPDGKETAGKEGGRTA